MRHSILWQSEVRRIEQAREAGWWWWGWRKLASSHLALIMFIGCHMIGFYLFLDMLNIERNREQASGQSFTAWRFHLETSRVSVVSRTIFSKSIGWVLMLDHCNFSCIIKFIFFSVIPEITKLFFFKSTNYNFNLEFVTRNYNNCNAPHLPYSPSHSQRPVKGLNWDTKSY